MSACVTEGGAVYTWGEGLHGELGHGAATTSLPSPVAVARLWGLRVAAQAHGLGGKAPITREAMEVGLRRNTIVRKASITQGDRVQLKGEEGGAADV